MANISREDFINRVTESISDGSADEQTDNSGQIIIYTNLYEWNNGSIHDVPDPNWKD